MLPGAFPEPRAVTASIVWLPLETPLILDRYAAYVAEVLHALRYPQRPNIDH